MGFHGAENKAYGDGDRALIWAANSGNTDLVRWLLEQGGSSIDERDNNGHTALHMALQGNEDHRLHNDNPDMVNLLLSYKVNLNAKNIDEETALMWAVRSNTLKSAFILLDKEADIDAKNKYGNTLLNFAAHRGHAQVVQYLRERGANLNATDNYGRTALHHAAAKGHVHVIQYLSEHGATLDVKDNNGRTALLYAVLDGHVQVVQHFLDKDENIHEKSTEINTALPVAAANGYSEIVSYLLSKSPSTQAINSALLSAAKNNRADVVKYLLGNNAEINSTAVDKNRTTLIYSIINGNIELAKYLLEKGANIHARDGDGNSPLIELVNQGHTEIVKTWWHSVLSNEDKLKTLIHLVEKDYTELMQCLLDECADINAKDSQGSTLLGRAVWLNYFHITRALLDKGAEININNEHERNRMFAVAVRNDWQGIVDRLLGEEAVFTYAEQHVSEYGEHVRRFIECTITQLAAEQSVFERANPDGMFDVTGARARLYFYMTRHLIRRNQEDLLPHIIYLLSIPSVSALVAETVTPNQTNELLRLAMIKRNQKAIDYLVQYPEVCLKAETSNYYSDEMVGRQMNLRAIAQDMESSMRGLNPKEVEQQMTLQRRYQETINTMGVGLFDAVQDDLKSRYLAHPAIVVNGGEDHSLPMEWSEFIELTKNWSEHDCKAALQAYYTHPVHTALRYLSKPNYWMARHAGYVITNPDNRIEQWADFERYKPLIGLYWLAATDVALDTYDGITSEGRVEHFIMQLALIGRAHNWDYSRLVTDSQGRTLQEQYDDLEGDKPSCSSGMNLRLFQSIIGHPDLEVKTMTMTQVLMQKVIDFVREHFRTLINEENKAAIRTAYEEYVTYSEDSSAHLLRLKELDIPKAKQEELMGLLAGQFGRDFNVDTRLLLTILFNLITRDKNGRIKEESAHFISLFSDARLESFLIPSAAHSNQLRFFVQQQRLQSEIEINEVLQDQDMPSLR